MLCKFLPKEPGEVNRSFFEGVNHPFLDCTCHFRIRSHFFPRPTERIAGELSGLSIMLGMVIPGTVYHSIYMSRRYAGED